jgi:hypothetical protein
LEKSLPAIVVVVAHTAYPLFKHSITAMDNHGFVSVRVRRFRVFNKTLTAGKLSSNTGPGYAVCVNQWILPARFSFILTGMWDEMGSKTLEISDGTGQHADALQMNWQNFPSPVVKNVATFMIYASVMLEKFPNNGQEYIKYIQTVRMAASRGVNGGWVQYSTFPHIKCPAQIVPRLSPVVTRSTII